VGQAFRKVVTRRGGQAGTFLGRGKGRWTDQEDYVLGERRTGVVYQIEFYKLKRIGLL